MNDAKEPSKETMTVTRPDRIVLTPNERGLIAAKIATVRQGEAARDDIASIANCIVERAGFPLGDYELDAAGTALIHVGDAAAVMD